MRFFLARHRRGWSFSTVINKHPRASHEGQSRSHGSLYGTPNSSNTSRSHSICRPASHPGGHQSAPFASSDGAGGSGDDDQFPEVFTEFYNWASERKENFEDELETASSLFSEARDLLGEGDAGPHLVVAPTSTLENWAREMCGAPHGN